jgi:general secretion pathway protein H
LESRQLSVCGAHFMAPMRTFPPRRGAQHGFTLIEIMVVVVIIGVLVIGAILSLGATGKDSGLEQERDRLVALIAYGRERGAMLTLEYGIRCGQHGYRFAFYDNRLMQWSPETVDDTLRPRRLPAGLQFRLLIEGHEIVLDDKALQVNPVAAKAPGGTTSLASVAAAVSAAPSAAAAGSAAAAPSAAVAGWAAVAGSVAAAAWAAVADTPAVVAWAAAIAAAVAAAVAAVASTVRAVTTRRRSCCSPTATRIPSRSRSCARAWAAA